MKIKAFNLLNQNGNPSANQIEILIYDRNVINKVFQSYNDIIAKLNDNTLIIDYKSYENSMTTTKNFNMWLDNNGIDPKEIRKIFNKGGGILKGEYNDLHVIISNLN